VLSAKRLTVEAMAGGLLARGHTTISIDPDRPGAARVILGAPCDATEACADSTFCDGVETCDRGVCTPGPPPCAASTADCVVVECDERQRMCRIEARHELCAEEVAEDGTTYPTYCDPTRGCQRGAPCLIDEECGDDRMCNGEERCIGQRCEPGLPPELDDDNECTIDVCLEPDGPRHLPDPDRDGVGCGGAGAASICVAGVCSPARCGDGFITAPEVCEDGNDNPNDGCFECRPPTWGFAELITGWGESRLDPHRASMTPMHVHVDPFGHLYVVGLASVIMRLDADAGLFTAVAGNGTESFSGDGGPATGAGLGVIADVVVDSLGAIYVSDSRHEVIRRIDPATGTIETFAGRPTFSDDGTSSGDGGPASAATFAAVGALAADGQGNLYVDDGRRIRRIDTNSGVIDTIHTSSSGFLDLQFGGDDQIYFSRDHQIFRLDPGGQETPIAGTGQPGALRLAGEGGPATATDLINTPQFAVTPSGDVYYGMYWYLRRVDGDTGSLTTVAGNGVPFTEAPHDSVEEVSFVTAVAVDPAGGVFVAEPFVTRVRRYFEGSMALAIGLGAGYRQGEGRRADTVAVRDIDALTVDDAGHVYALHNNAIGVALVSNIVRIDPAGIMTHVAGRTDAPGDSGDGGPALEAQFRSPERIEVVTPGRLLLADTANFRVRSIELMSRTIDTVIGTGTQSTAVPPAGTVALSVPLDGPVGVGWYDGVVVGDRGLVRRIDPNDGTVSVIAGTTGDGSGFADGGPATEARMQTPLALVPDRRGGLLILERSSHSIRRLDAAGNLTRVAGDGPAGFAGDGMTALEARFRGPQDLDVDAAGNVFIADTGNNRVRRIDASTNIVTTVAGNGSPATRADGGPAIDADLGAPIGVEVAPNGDLIIATSTTVRRVAANTGIITTLLGPAFPAGDGPLTQSALTGPVALATIVRGRQWLVADRSSGRVRLVDRDAGELRTVVGYEDGHRIDGGSALYADRLDDPSGVAYDPTTQQAYISERGAHVIRRLDLSVDPPALYDFAGVRGVEGHADAGRARTLFSSPAGLAIGGDGALYVADMRNHVVRRLDLRDSTAPTRTIAGQPQRRGFHGDGGPATDALLNAPEALLALADGTLYVSDTSNHRVRRVDTSGVIETVLGDGTASVSGAGRPARDFAVAHPRGLSFDRRGNVFVASPTAVRVVTADAAVYTIDVPQTFCTTDVVVHGSDDDHIAVLDRCQGYLTEIARR